MWNIKVHFVCVTTIFIQTCNLAWEKKRFHSDIKITRNCKMSIACQNKTTDFSLNIFLFSYTEVRSKPSKLTVSKWYSTYMKDVLVGIWEAIETSCGHQLRSNPHLLMEKTFNFRQILIGLFSYSIIFPTHALCVALATMHW